jgi:tetratricopeptide (TPR) repeat protein
MKLSFINSLLFVTACLSSLAGAQTVRSHISDGNALYKNDKFADAEAEYRKSLEKDNQVMQGYFDLGDALYKQQRYDEAVQNYQNALTKTNAPKVQAQLHHNLGNVHLEQKSYQGGIDEYKRSLKLNPGDEETKYNLAYAEKMLKQQQQQNKQNKQNKNDKNQQKDQQKKQQDKDKQDKDKQDQQKQNQQQQQKQQQQQEKQISRADAERILDALKNDEKNVQKQLHKKQVVKGNVEKDW